MSHAGKVSVTVAVAYVFPGLSGGAVFFGKDAEGESYHFVADYSTISGAPEDGEIWTVEGMWERHPRHGLQVRVKSALRVKPSGVFIIHYLTHNKAFRGIGIGIRKAQRLWEEFGEELYKLLSVGDVRQLSTVITPSAAVKLVEVWNKNAEEGEILQLLADCGLDLRLANKVRSVWGREAVEKVRGNPYRMLAFASWNKVDRAARSLGIMRNDPRRQVAAVEGYLYRRLDAKHTVTPHENAVRGISFNIGTCDSAEAQAAIERALSEHAITEHDGGYQPFGASFMERFVAERFRSMINGSTSKQGSLFSGGLESVVADATRKFEEENGIKLNAEQAAGVKVAVDMPLSVLTGGAGVGKTTVLKVIHEVCERTGIIIRQMALSGRAAQRMREATGREATTIAKFLSEANQGKIECLSELLVIIDECSMLDLSLLYSIVRVLPPHTRLLLVGDPYQLPPIGFGLIFHVLARSPNVPNVELLEVHRQAESTGIPQVAYSIRHGLVPRLPSFGGAAPGVYFVEANGAAIPEQLLQVIEELHGCENMQILGVTKRGSSGVENINSMLHNIHLMSANPPPKKLAGWDFAEGDPVIYLANDYERELWNGTLGRVEKVRGVTAPSSGKVPSNCSLLCDFDGVKHELTESDLHKLALAYAVTVHKAQGSQFRRIVMPVSRSRLFDRTLVYTALTRGIEQVVFVGERRAFEEAVVAPPSASQRQVGFVL